MARKPNTPAAPAADATPETPVTETPAAPKISKNAIGHTWMINVIADALTSDALTVPEGLTRDQLVKIVSHRLAYTSPQSTWRSDALNPRHHNVAH